ncbi:nuclear transport factor 2 family protein [Nocardioides terrisoli]|uniref:nuclear transport factor 2 family protein n=1 Tax=Nocardioides terrisoli TaxID=3388267 RepID=UPI00287BBCD4|nr:nuclear transport factor 2 family protein [Nocardioides marmorisolisilvae]
MTSPYAAASAADEVLSALASLQDEPQRVCELWDRDPSAVHFGSGGHVYRGAGHIALAVQAGVPGILLHRLDGPEVSIVGDVAWVVSGVGDGETERLTAVLVRTADGWHVIHIHQSQAAGTGRPGGI